MALRPRITGRERARASSSPISRAFLSRIAPLFAGDEIAGGPMLCATIIALAMSSSSLAPAWEAFWNLPIFIGIGPHSTSHSIAEWIDYTLLPLFFIMIGADMKKEIVTGELSRWQTAAFPLLGAIGGMILPVAIFLAIANDADTARGWGTVIVTDTAFGLALLAMFSTSFPPGLRALLLAFAAIDDVGGLLVIAGAYSRDVGFVAIGVAACALGLMLVLRRLRWFASFPYIILSLMLWAGVFASGVHATIAGVLIGFVAPVKARLGKEQFSQEVQGRIDDFQDAYREQRVAEKEGRNGGAGHQVDKHLGYLDEMTSATEVTGHRLIGLLTPWVSYIVLPLFVLSNVHVSVAPSALMSAISSPLAPAVTIALLIGKPIGFLFASWLGTALGIARLPKKVSWPMVVAISSLAGIGFTISLFIADLAFSDPQRVEQASLGTLAASATAGLTGYLLLKWASGRKHFMRAD